MASVDHALLKQTTQAVEAYIEHHRISLETMSDTEITDLVRRFVQNHLREIGERERLGHPFLEPGSASSHRNSLIQSVLDHMLGLGPLSELLRTPQISEIMVNGAGRIFVESEGVMRRIPASFESEQALQRVIERIVQPLGRRIDESSPMLDGRLQCGSRVNIVLPPLAVDGAMLTIRKFQKRGRNLNELVETGMFCPNVQWLLAKAVVQKQNVVLSGGTGTGKTTLLNGLANEIQPQARVISIEDAAELDLPLDNWVRLESRQANQEGMGEVSIRQLVINALRMRPDRIVVGECRSGEALDMLQAMNSGHAGSMTTLHANAPREALQRLETMVLMAGFELPLVAIRQQICSAIQFVIQITRDLEGKRRIDSIVELRGFVGETIQLAEIVRFNVRQKTYQFSGEMPEFIAHLSAEEQAVFRAFSAQPGDTPEDVY
ncbi:CpaF family protein [Aliidiomarina sanyensis]|uniref:Pilus assembly protein CpaF n=1 Tax=Aliidiomarina sanyensis TaxID=1249555 RepID=A0A432WEN3_9GAMM|nr:CpaF family protein [Aliidiomarina sanyensis]RUO31339.1 pilus assembly protein CpaF [Aliidiomarina sanyensis]